MPRFSASPTVCVYCGSRDPADPALGQIASDLGDRMAHHGIAVVYGGGSVGLMGRVAQAALAGGGEVYGIIPEHLQALEIEHPALTGLHIVTSMHERKMMMATASDAFVILPGGLGTLDEMFEILTWRQLGLHGKPVILLNARSFWDPLITLLGSLRASGFLHARHHDLLWITESVEQTLDIVRHIEAPTLPPSSERM